VSTRYLTAMRLLGIVSVLTVAYYLLPAGGRLTAASWTVLFVAGIVVLAALALTLVGGLLRAGPDVRLQRLFVLLCVTVLFFAEAYYLLARMPGQVADSRTKTDALYFTITTLSTVGYGDVHAVGQLARVAVIVQIIFDLSFLGTAITVASGILRTKAARLGPQHGETQSGTAPRSGPAESGPGDASGNSDEPKTPGPD
jgi:voltage-gated potassium channel